MNPVAFYVAPDGNDQWSGKLVSPNRQKTDGPFATVRRARDAVRELKEEGGLKNPVTILIRGGVYWLDEPLVFTVQDSGTEECPITYQKYGDEKTVLSGGRVIRGWKQVEVNGKKMWTAEVPEAKTGAWYFRQLFVNGEHRRRARIPNEGFLQIAEPMDVDQNLPSNEGQSRFKFKLGDIKKWDNLDDAEVVVLHNWTESRLRIATVDEQSSIVTFTGRSVHRLEQGWPDVRYYVENVFEGLDAPGEWYLNRQTGIVHYMPLPGEDLTRSEVIASKLEQLVRLEGNVDGQKFVQHLHLRGLTFYYTDWTLPARGYGTPQAEVTFPNWGTQGISAAIAGEGALSCIVEECTIAHTSTHGIEFGRGCKNNLIIANDLYDLGGGGIKIGEGNVETSFPMAGYIRERNIDEACNNVVSDNHIYDGGHIFPGAVGIWVGQSSGNTISHNHIHDFYYTGISVGWTWGYLPTRAKRNIIEYNHIHHVMRWTLSDGGGIYTLGVQPGTVIRGNLIHDVYAYAYGGWGIYLDEGSSNIIIENNVVYRTKDGGFNLHYGKNNTIRNNIFAFGMLKQFSRGRPNAITFQRNIVYWKEGKLFSEGARWSWEISPENSKKPDMVTYYRLLYPQIMYATCYSAFDYNLYFDTSGQPIRFAEFTLEEWQKFRHDVHSIIADPLFVDPEHDDFTLKPESPAFQLGFNPIDIKHVGPRKTSHRKASSPPGTLEPT